jgi:hypothetical protein
MQALTTDTLAIPTVSAITVAAIQWLKKSSWFPWLSDTSSKLALRGTSLLTAFAAAAGIHFTFSAEAGTLAVSGLTVATILPALWAWLKSMVFNELIFQAAVKAPGNAAQASKVSTANNTLLSGAVAKSGPGVEKQPDPPPAPK